jgi:pyroglutamyl-peptidase
LERFAINIKDFSIPDRAGNHPKGDPIRNDGPPAYQQTLPDLEGCLQALRAAGVPAIISNHAGTHMCNQALYEALDIASTTGIRTKCGFIHIPLLEEQLAAVSDREDRHAMSHSMSLETLRRALERVLLHTVGALEAVSTDAAPARR